MSNGDSTTDVVTAGDRAVTTTPLGYGDRAVGQGKAAAKPPAKKPPPRYLNLANQAKGELVTAYPALKNVTVREWKDLKNPYVKKNQPGWWAWTNSKDEIYVNAKITSPASADAVMQHEALHVDQFIGSGVPPSYLEMVRFERDAYRDSAAYLARRIAANPPDVATYEQWKQGSEYLSEKFRKLIEECAGQDPAAAELKVTKYLIKENDIPAEVMDKNRSTIVIPAPKLYVP